MYTCIVYKTVSSGASYSCVLMLTFRYTGMLEAVRVRREGYSYRPFFSDFVTSYRAVAYSFTEEVQCVHVHVRIHMYMYIIHVLYICHACTFVDPVTCVFVHVCMCEVYIYI